MIDLHIHSCFSDGIEAPDVLVKEAVSRGINYLSLTDHDTVEGQPEMLASCFEYGVTCITGIEVSALCGKEEYHILGYGIDIDNVDLQYQLEILKKSREKRNKLIIEKLESFGIFVSMENIDGYDINKPIGRMHIARLMLDKGYVSSLFQAFDEYLGIGKKAYMHRDLLSPEETIDAIHGAGGVAFLAHPKVYGLSKNDYIKLLDSLIMKGLDGVEAFYSLNNEYENAFYYETAIESGLAVCCGSDHHGDYIEPKIIGNTGCLDVDSINVLSLLGIK